ncbi:MAG: preprotein translocase subunit SecA, partial [Candidatus Paceibacterota bacterium]
RGVDIKLGGPQATPEESEEIKKLGGLFVIGTERHEARRIDNPLRGRSGRQGDPGETQFFVSLEDDLMKVFATDTIKNMMGRFGIPEDQPIENYLITRGLENAQTKIEGFHFDARKHTLEYDNVLSVQRKTVYERRRKILLGSDEEVLAMFYEIYMHASEEDKQAIDTKKQNIKPEEYVKIIRHIVLQAIDIFWVDHLELVDYTRSSVNLRAYGQRDPLVEYKREGLRLYKEMWQAIDSEVIRIISHLEFQV